VNNIEVDVSVKHKILLVWHGLAKKDWLSNTTFNEVKLSLAKSKVFLVFRYFQQINIQYVWSKWSNFIFNGLTFEMECFNIFFSKWNLIPLTTVPFQTKITLSQLKLQRKLRMKIICCLLDGATLVWTKLPNLTIQTNKKNITIKEKLRFWIIK
jgi:hypothetical protein